MKAWLRGFFYSFPVQLLFLHFRKYQVLLIFWFVLFSTINGTFMKSFGADSLYLAPEYLGNVNALGAAIVGIGHRKRRKQCPPLNDLDEGPQSKRHPRVLGTERESATSAMKPLNG